MLLSHGYDALGVDPRAPSGPRYKRSDFERAGGLGPVDAVIASTSLHHVSDPGDVIERVARTLSDEGTVVVIEWAWERFDAATAHWCFERISKEEAGWLHHCRDEWKDPGQNWRTYVGEWAARDGLHRGDALLRLLEERFERRSLTYGPYFFPDLSGTSEADEQAAIDAGEIQATRLDWLGTPR
jgi:SAM-dependent methyltransferase